MLIERVQLTNLLSFGPDSLTLELEPLNVLIGPNGSGKSNLIEALGLLAAAPEDIGRTLHVSGDVTDWIWRRRESLSDAEIRVVVASSGDDGALSYRLGFGGVGKFLQITNEVVESATNQRAETKPARHLVRPAPSPSMALDQMRPKRNLRPPMVSANPMPIWIQSNPFSPDAISTRCGSLISSG